MTNPTETNETCRRCRKGTLIPQAAESLYEHNGNTLTFADEYMRCEQCGHESYTNEQSLARSRAVTAAIRKAENLLSGEDIRAARLSYGLSLSEFERALGVGKNTVGRWERGTVPPSASANLGLWVAKTKRSAFIEWAASRGVNIEPTRNQNAAQIETFSSPSLPGTMVEQRIPARKSNAVQLSVSMSPIVS